MEKSKRQLPLHVCVLFRYKHVILTLFCFIFLRTVYFIQLKAVEIYYGTYIFKNIKLFSPKNKCQMIINEVNSLFLVYKRFFIFFFSGLEFFISNRRILQRPCVRTYLCFSKSVHLLAQWILSTAATSQWQLHHITSVNRRRAPYCIKQ